MTDSKDVLDALFWVYTIYSAAIISLIGWFAYRVTTKGEGKLVKPSIFYSYVGVLIFIGVSIHIYTFNTIPWVPMDLNRSEIQAEKTFDITMEDHQFIFPSEKLMIDCKDKVLFNVLSNDLTYGFGVFRKDGTMMFQMQVVPGHINDILWQFNKPGEYTIRSTEYSGPKGAQMIEKDIIIVGNCN